MQQKMTESITIDTLLLQDVTAYNTGSLSRISFYYPPTFTDHDVVLIFTRYLNAVLYAACIIKYINILQAEKDILQFSIQFEYYSYFAYRFLRTKKDRDRYKFKQEEIIGNVIEGKVNDRRESKINSGDIGYLSYGTV